MKDVNGGWVAVGIASFEWGNKETVDVFTRLSDFIPFIQKKCSSEKNQNVTKPINDRFSFFPFIQ